MGEQTRPVGQQAAIATRARVATLVEQLHIAGADGHGRRCWYESARRG